MKYLVPTDFSQCAQNASVLAIDLAKKSGAELIFLHLMSIPIDWVGLEEKVREKMYPSTTTLVHRAEEKLKEWEGQASKKGVKSTSHIHYNERKSFINNFAQESRVELIIMGSHGADEMKDYLIGTVTQRVMRFSKIPVLVVKSRLAAISKIGFISDFSEENVSNEKIITNFTKLVEAGLHLVYINTPLNFQSSRVIDKRLHDFQNDFNFITHTHIYNDYQFESGVANFCEDHEIDLIIMNTHGRKGLDRISAGNLTENIIANLEIPVLSIPLPGKSV